MQKLYASYINLLLDFSFLHYIFITFFQLSDYTITLAQPGDTQLPLT